MFFYISKIVWAVLSPLNLIFLLLAAGIVFFFFHKTTSRIFIGGAFTLFLLFGTLPIGHNMLVLLENKYKRPETMPDWVNAIFVPGGSFETSISESRGIPSLNDSADRITESMQLANMYPNAAIIFSGGNGHLLHGERTEADDTEQFLQNIGFNTDNVLYENESRNTFQNVRITRNLFTPMPEETWIVVTSAYHMPRTMAVMKTLSWPGQIIPYPVDYRTDGKITWIPRRFDILANLYETKLALHEYLGALGYRVNWKITLPVGHNKN